MALRIVEQDEVDIAGIIQLASAELAHAEHREAALVLDVPWGRLRVGQVKASLALRGAPQQVRAGEVEGGLGELGQRMGDLREPPGARDVGDGDGECHHALRPAQRLGDLRAGCSGRDGGERGEAVRDHGLRVHAPLHHPANHVRLAEREIAEVGAVAAERVEQRRAFRACGEAGPFLAERREAFAQTLGGVGIGRAGKHGGAGLRVHARQVKA